MLERGHAEAFFKWQLSRACKYLLTVHRCLGEAAREGQMGLCGSIGEASIHQQESGNCIEILNHAWGTYRKSNLTGPRGAQRAAWGPGWFLREGPGVREAPRSPGVPEGGIRHMDLPPTCRGLWFPGSVPPCTLGPGGSMPPRGPGVAALSEQPWTVERRLEAQEDRRGCSATSPAGEGGGLGPAAQAGGYPHWAGVSMRRLQSVFIKQTAR